MPNRLPIIDISAADADQRAALIEWRVDRKVTNPPGGLFGILVASAEGMRRVSKLGAFGRTRTILQDAPREAAVVFTAAHEGYDYEVQVHSATLGRLGVDAAAVEALRAGKTGGLPDGIREAAGLAQAMCAGGEVPQAVFDAARLAFGDQGVVEMSIVIGYYLMLSRLAKVYDV